MTNIREFIEEKLRPVCPNLKLNRPEGDVVFPLLTYSEITNTHVELWHDRVTYQIDAYENTFEDCLDLIYDADRVMSEIGFKRTYLSPDSTTREGQDLYHKTASYTADINTRINNLYINK